MNSVVSEGFGGRAQTGQVQASSLVASDPSVNQLRSIRGPPSPPLATPPLSRMDRWPRGSRK